MNRTLALIGVPSSAGAHWPGQEKTPQYLRAAGLRERLEAVGLVVVDHGDLPRVRFRPDPTHRRQQNLPAVVEVTRQVAGQVDHALQRGAIPLVIGGDCTIALGVLAGFLRHSTSLGLLYFDGHIDLNTSATSVSGILDSMGVAHMLGAPGTADALSHIGPRFPLMSAEQMVVFGYNPREINDAEHDALARYPLVHYPLDTLQGNAAATAAEARIRLEQRVERFVVHFDVDVIDFTDFPIADVPQFNAGLPFRDAMACLAVFVASPKFAGLTITEFNPDHADEDGILATTFVEHLAHALAGTRLEDNGSHGCDAPPSDHV